MIKNVEFGDPYAGSLSSDNCTGTCSSNCSQLFCKLAWNYSYTDHWYQTYTNDQFINRLVLT